MKHLKFYTRNTKNILRRAREYRRSLLASAGVLIILYAVLVSPPAAFPTHDIITIPPGATLADAAHTLQSEGVIRSETLFQLFVRVWGSEHSVQSGDYFFEEPVGVFGVARRVADGSYGLTPVRVTVFEGTSAEEMAQVFAAQLRDDFPVEEFVSLASSEEGYLFPDTYFFLPTASPAQIISAMRQNFDTRTTALREQAEREGKDFHEIVTVASIIEEEAMTEADKRVVSGILWKRIAIGMPLQVDATFLYINGKNTFELTLEDLAHESPYNTYAHRGLPPGPISSPGLVSIDAALNPESSPYLYYLSDLASHIHYARDFEEHKVNRARYLD